MTTNDLGRISRTRTFVEGILLLDLKDLVPFSENELFELSDSIVTLDPTIFCVWVVVKVGPTGHFDRVWSKSNVGKYVKKTCCKKK